MKHIKSGNCSYISTENTEKQSEIYTRARIDRTKVYHSELVKLNDTCAAWEDEDENFNLGIENFGVDVDTLNMPSVPNFYFLCWIEEPYPKEERPCS